MFTWVIIIIFRNEQAWPLTSVCSHLSSHTCSSFHSIMHSAILLCGINDCMPLENLDKKKNINSLESFKIRVLNICDALNTSQAKVCSSKTVSEGIPTGLLLKF